MNDGCIHASKQGWEDLMGTLYDAYFKVRLGQEVHIIIIWSKLVPMPKQHA